MSPKQKAAMESARRVLWSDREILLPHVIEHVCPVGREIEILCDVARWDYLSYLTAAVFDDADLLRERTK